MAESLRRPTWHVLSKGWEKMGCKEWDFSGKAAFKPARGVSLDVEDLPELSKARKRQL